MNLKLFTVAVAAAGAATYLYRRQVARHAAVDIPVYPEIDDGADMGAGDDLSVLGEASSHDAQAFPGASRGGEPRATKSTASIAPDA